MLKVVGASWYKTRISTYILLGAGFLSIGAFFIAEMERPQYNGIYCSTIFWSEKIGFQIEYWKQRNDLANIPKGVARTCYKDSIHQNGWSQLEVETQRNYPDWVQAFGAGVLEGTLTWNNIYNQWLNTIAGPCDQDEFSQNFCNWLRDIVDDNYATIKEKSNNLSTHDHYWHQIRLFYYQLEGIEAGYIRGASRARSGLELSIPFVDFLLMNSASDMQDLKVYFINAVMRNSKETKLNTNFINGRALMLVKIIQQSGDWKLLLGHSAAASYSTMLRIQKRYKFRYHFTSDKQNAHNVPGTDISFTGYPGILASTDDFYIIKGRKMHTVVAGVEIKNVNLNLIREINLKNLMPLTARVMAANRLGQNRKGWEKAMSHHPFTGSKQWIQVDLKKFNQLQIFLKNSINDETNYENYDILLPKTITNDLIWLAEQLPGKFKTINVANEMTINGSQYYFNGVQYFDDNFIDGELIKQNLSENLLDETKNMTKLEHIDTFLRKYAFRGDLIKKQSIPYGNIDMKLFSYDANRCFSDYHAISGPLFVINKNSIDETVETELGNSLIVFDNYKQLNFDDNLSELEIISDSQPSRSIRNDIQAIAMKRQQQLQDAPFKWSNIQSDISKLKGVQHSGHPNEWNFEKVSPSWAWQD